MATLHSIFDNRSTGPYAKPVKVKVVARAEQPLKYKGPDGSDRQALTVAVSDSTSCCRCVCYDTTKFGKLTTGQTVVLREIIRKREDDQSTIVATKATKIFISSNIEVPAEHTAEGLRIVNPPAADTVTINAALRSPVKQKISVSGKIVQEEDIRTVSVKGTEVPIKNVTLEDSTGKSKVTLWRDAAQACVKTGDYVVLTDVVVNTYKNETSLSSTSRTKVEKSEAPLEDRLLVVTGVCLEEGKAELLSQNDDIVTVPAELLMQAMPGEAPEVELLTVNGPVTLSIQQKGSDVISISLASNTVN